MDLRKAFVLIAKRGMFKEPGILNLSKSFLFRTSTRVILCFSLSSPKTDSTEIANAGLRFFDVPLSNSAGILEASESCAAGKPPRAHNPTRSQIKSTITAFFSMQIISLAASCYSGSFEQSMPCPCEPSSLSQTRT